MSQLVVVYLRVASSDVQWARHPSCVSMCAQFGQNQTAAGSGDAVVNFNLLQCSNHHEPCVYIVVSLFIVADKMLIQVNISGMSRVVCQSEFGVV